MKENTLKLPRVDHRMTLFQEVMRMERVAREVSPRFLSFSERIYNISGANYSFQDLVRYVRTGLSCAKYSSQQTQLNKSSGDTADMALGVTALVADLYDFPFWVVPPVMAQVVANVIPPEEWDVKSTLFGFPAMYFIMPRNSFKGDLGEDIAVISVAHLTDDVRDELDRRDVSVVKTERTRDAQSCLLVSATSSCGAIWHMAIPIPENGIIDRAVLESLPTHTNVPSDNETGWLHSKLLPYVTTILGIMNARPETSGVASACTKKVKGTGREVWSTRIFGEKYAKAFNEGRGIPTGRHVQTHWRSGHFRQQRYGAGNASIKQVLIDAVLVNAPK